MTKLPGKLGSEYYRGFLTQQGKLFYDRINTQLLRKDYSGKLSFPISNSETAASDCFAAYKAIRDDHPEYFYLGFQSEFVRSGQIGTFAYSILYSLEMIESIQQQMRKSINRIVRGTSHLPMITREMLVYERIARKLSYANHSDARDHNIVGPILMSSGVCEGQNALLLLCFRQIGIPCIKVYGRTQTERWHCWTIAWIHGTPVHCDVTWDGMQEGIVRFDYWNLSDHQIAGDHFDFQGSRVPVCTSEAFSYYCHYNLCVNSFEELRARLKADSSNGISPIRIHFSYHPSSCDYLEEAQRACLAEQISEKYILYYHPTLKNLAVKPI